MNFTKISRLHGKNKLSYFFIGVAIFLSACGSQMSEREQLLIAQEYLFKYEEKIIDEEYGGGVELYSEIIRTEYDRSKENLRIFVKFTFKGQYSGLNYWAKGILQVDNRSGEAKYETIAVDPKLEDALSIQNKLENELIKGIELLLN